MPKTLIFDIETSPNLVHVWRFWQENVGVNQILEDGDILSFAAKWVGKDEVHYYENRTRNDKRLVKQLIKLLNEADIVVAHNGKRFDMGWVRARAAIHGLTPPSPVKIIDTKIETKKSFFFPSYSLDYLTKVFGCSRKLTKRTYPGHELWMACVVRNEDKAWEEMMAYNIQDVLALEELYLKVRPWIKHPNVGVYTDEEVPVCPSCGGTHLQKRGFYYTDVSKFQRYSCMAPGCGYWSRGKTNLLTKEKREATVRNAV